MKTIFKKIGLSLAAFACAISAGVGVALSVPQTTEANAAIVTLEDRNYYISGTGVRLVNDKNGAGLRFHTNLLASEYAKVEESGTLIIPEFRYDGELTLDDLNKESKNRPTHIVTMGTVNGKKVNYWRDYDVNGEAFKRASVYLYDIPEVGYGTRMVVVSYVKIDGQYVYTSVIDGSNYISLSTAASRAMAKADVSDADKARLDPFVVDETKVTFVALDGTKTTQMVKYGSKLTAPQFNYDQNWFVFEGWKDQYGNVWDFEHNVVSYPVTLTPSLAPAEEVKQVASKVLGDCWGATAPERAWVNGSTPEVLKSGVPAGFNVLNKFTWYKDSTSIWKINSNPLYRACYDNTDLSSYEKVRFMLKLETEGDAYVTFSNKGQVIKNEWLTFELTQNTPGVWSLKVFNESGVIVHQVDNYSRFEENVDSLRSLVFPSAWTQALGHTFTTKLMPATSTEHDVYVYVTDILGYAKKDVSVYPTASTTVVWEHIWNNYYFEGGGVVEGVWSDEAAPSGFTKVSEYSWTSTTSNDMGKVGHFNDSDISAYSDLFFAMKVKNGMDIYIQGAPSFYTGGDWLYVHMYQAEDGTWSKDFMSIDGSYSVFGKQKGLVGTKLTQMMNWVRDINTGSYPRLDMTAGLTATAYFTEVRGILKDGSGAEEGFKVDIPDNAIMARQYVWRNDKYSVSVSNAGAPEGFSSVLTHTWNATRTDEYVFCLDSTMDISLYTDLYFATKLVSNDPDAHIYLRNSSVGHYRGSEWLYLHYSRNEDGTWSLSFQSADGHIGYSTKMFTATTLNALLSNNVYGHALANQGTVTYWTDVRAIAKEAYGERAVWSAVDKVTVEKDFVIGMPAGFSNLYKKDNFVMTDLATLDLSDGYYDEIKFGLITNQDFYLRSNYNYTVAGESAPRQTTAINSKLPAWDCKLNVFTFTNLGNGSWQLTLEGRLWYNNKFATGESASSTGQVDGIFTYTVKGNTLYEVMNNFMSKSGNVTTAYCTEVRGVHTHKASKTVSLGNGTLQDYCACGMVMGEPVDFAHDIPADAATVLPSIWREDNYALSGSTTMEVPVGFTNVKEYDWLGNTANAGAAWGASVTNMSTYCINSADDLTGYSDIYFAMRIVGGKDIYIRGLGDNATYSGGDWLYVHYQQTGNGVWRQTVRSVDGYEHVTEGVIGTTLKEMMDWGDANHPKNALFPRRNEGDVAPKVYFTDVRAVANAHEHAVASYVSNGDGTHNALCTCGAVLEVANCYGGTATCTLPSICSVCNTAYGDTLEHNYVWSIGKYACENCGDVAQAGVKAANNIVYEPFLGQALVANADLGGVTAPAGFSSVQRFDSKEWASSALGAGYFNRSGLGAYSQFWFAVKLSGCYMSFIGKAADYAKGEWVNFHFTRVGEYTWDIEISINGTVYLAIENQDGLKLDVNRTDNSLARMLYDGGYGSTDGNAVLIYHSKNGTASIYSTEVIGILDPYMSVHAVKVRDNIWRSNNYALSASTSEPVPAGFTMIKEYNWSTNPANNWGATSKDFPFTCLDEATVVGYQEVYFAMKLVNGTGFYVRNGSSYTGGEWLYYHFVKGSDGLWSLTIRTADGYEYINVHKGIRADNLTALMSYTGDDTAGNPMRGCYPTKVVGTEDVRVYMTDMWAVLDGTTHTASKYESNGDGTHNVVCECGYALQTSVPCAGGKATCSQQAICSDCGSAYGDVLQHEGEWNANNEFVCVNCGANFGQIDTELDKQTVALFTNATSIEANKTTGLVIDLSKAIPMSISSVKSVALDSLTYDGATLSGNKITIPVFPNNTYGEYTATATVVVEGKEFEITVPVLVVTDLITTDAGMQSLRFVLRGADTEADENGGIGGKGGEATMNGDGYYMLGGNITLSKGTYVYGTSYVPFVGTFDGDGYSLNGYGWHNWYGGAKQDMKNSTYAQYLEGSLFGVVDGVVKNVAFTNCKFGIYENIMHSGNGLFEDCYMEVLDMNTDPNMYTPAIFARQEAYGVGTLRNFIVDYSNFNSPLLDAAINTPEIDDLTPTNDSNTGTRYMSAAGKIYTAENVLVVSFNKKYISLNSGRGNIYTDRAGNHSDGAEVGIRAEYTDGTNNGALFAYANLDANLWKMVNGKPYLVKMNVSGTAIAPEEMSPSQNKDELDGYIANNDTTQYYIAWENNPGATRAARFINNTMKASTGANLAVGCADVDNLWKKQIVVGSYANYRDKVDSLNEKVLSDDSYGLYLVGKTFFLLAESDEAFDMAGEEFCRRMFGWTEIAPNQFVMNTEATVAIPDSLDYTTEITFDARSGAFSNVYAEKTAMNFTTKSLYDSYNKSMHNTLDYLNTYTGDKTNFLNVNTEMDEKGQGNEVHGEQLCYTTRGDKASFDALLGQFVSEIVATAQANPKMTAINVMIEDDPDYCGCATCKQFSNPSIAQLIFLNELSYALAHNEYLLANGRTIAVEFFAYSSFYHAPILTESDITALNNLKSTLGLKAANATLTTNYKQLNTAGATYAAANDTTNFTVLKAENNLRLYWTSHKASHSFALTHEANDHMYLPLLAWSACVDAEDIDVFMYQTSFWDLQLPLNTWEYQVIWYQELNALGIGNHIFNLGNVYNKLESQTAFSAFKAYIDSRAMTDRNVTFEQLKDEFFSTNGYYGAAGPQMRDFFDELVSAMERKKQGGGASILKDNNDNTSEYVDASQFRYYPLDKDGNPIKPGETTTVVKPATPQYWRIQAFFNGVYGLSEGALLFKQTDGTHNKVTDVGLATSTTIALEKAAHAYNLYVYGEKTQLETLKAWQGYCAAALKTPGLTTEQSNRIKAEAVFPEYAMLLFYTDYSVTFTRADNKATDWTKGATVCNLQSDVTLTSVSGSTLSYQELYDLMKSLGFETPSEQYGYDSVNNAGTTLKIGAGWMNISFKYKKYGVVTTETEKGYTLADCLYHSAFKTWGVTL